MRLAYRSFAAGEVSKRLAARVDQVKYQTGARVMRNFSTTLEGAATNRSGFGYVRPAHNFTADHPPRLLPFVRSDSQSHVLVLEDQRLSIVSNGAPQLVSAVNVSAVTQANPCKITTSGAHGLTTGDLVWIEGVAGMTQLNRRFFRAVVVDPDEFTLQEESGSAIDSSGFGAYTSGGTVEEVYGISAPWTADDLYQIRISATADVMFLAHPDYPLYQLELSGSTWTLSAVEFEPQIDRPTNASASGSAGSATVRYRVTAVAEDTLEESFPGTGTQVAVSAADSQGASSSKVITGITVATPPVVTSNAHGYSNGDFVRIENVVGMVEVNNRYFVVAGVAANTFQLNDEDGNPVNGTGYTAYSSGGTASEVFEIEFTTSTLHNLATNDEVSFDGLTGSAFDDFNDGVYIIRKISTTVFRIRRHYGVLTSAAGQSAFVFATSATRSSIAAPGSSTPVTVTWTAVVGALEYNIYREVNGVYGYVGTSATTSFIDLGYDVDPFDTPPIDRDVFAAADDYPGAVGLFQQRLLLGGSDNNIERIDAGRTGLLYNFTKSNPIQADDSFSWVMRSQKVQAIRHILEMSRCMVFTDSAVWTLEGDDAGALVPTAVNPRKRAEHGLGDVEPLPIGNAVLYVQAAGKIVREILPGSGDDFDAKDRTVYSRHLFDRNAIVSWTYAEEPSSIVWAARDDGTLLGFTYLREHEVWGWHRHDTGDGDRFVCVCAVPEGSESATYAVVRRFGVGDGDRYYIERMFTRQIAHQADGKFLDSYRSYESENATVGDTYTLNYSSGWTLTRSGTSDDWVTGDDSTDIGRVFLLYGTDGERYWCTIQSITSISVAVVSVRTDIPAEYDEDGEWIGAIDSDGAPTDLFPETLPFVTAEWSSSVSQITDLWHLEGREVYVVGDGYPQGPFTVTDGTITLTTPVVLVVVGLRIVAEVETLEPDNPSGESWVGREKTVSEIDVRVEETDGLKVGVSRAALAAWSSDKFDQQEKPTEGQPYTGTYRVNCAGMRTRRGSIVMRQDQGLPTTILGAYPEMSNGRGKD